MARRNKSLLAGRYIESDLRVLYRDVQAPGSHETITRRFWTALFEKELPDRHLHVVAEQAPNHGRQRVDAMAYRVQGDTVVPKLYVEFKRSGRRYRSLAGRGEQQVTDYCLQLLSNHPDRQSMYAMLCYGTAAKVWTVKKGSRAAHGQTVFIDADNDVGSALKQFFLMVTNL
ncbi:hypothetical protein FQN55_003761 [Onygenales sp. PD_40]|nr:hypothetical protein FQN55_003761 [Onygenales sp. PD_40]KAK2763503.1 hypothetical protein FQN53_007319 [Emmonsiellopsis sp. PD_33]